jgi:hypothetical protein
MLVRHTIRRKQFRKFDREATHKIATDNGADLDEAGRFNKILITRTALGAINKIASSAYQHHIANTLPWDDQGARLLPSQHYFEYTSAQRDYKQRYDAEVAKFVAAYPTYIEEAKARLMLMFLLSDYPAPETIADSFSMDVKIRPLPNVDDIRAGLPESEIERIKAELQSDLTAVVKAATVDLWTRLYESLKAMRDNLKEFAENEDKRFYRAWTTNVRDIATLIHKLNFENDQDLEDARTKTLALLDRYDTEAMKEDESVALEASIDADDILSDMIAYIGG